MPYQCEREYLSVTLQKGKSHSPPNKRCPDVTLYTGLALSENLRERAGECVVVGWPLVCT